jgi:hypothetical protein
MSDMLSQTLQEISLEALHSRVADLEKQLQMQSLEMETLVKRVPDTLIISPNFLKRAFTVYGHSIVAGLIIAVPLWCISFAVFILIGLASEY